MRVSCARAERGAALAARRRGRWPPGRRAGREPAQPLDRPARLADQDHARAQGPAQRRRRPQPVPERRPGRAFAAHVARRRSAGQPARRAPASQHRHLTRGVAGRAAVGAGSRGACRRDGGISPTPAASPYDQTPITLRGARSSKAAVRCREQCRHPRPSALAGVMLHSLSSRA